MNLKSQAGGVLIATLSFLMILSVGAAAILGLTATSYRLSMRNEVRAQARAVADSEMECLYYQFMTQILLATPPTSTPDALAALNLVDVSDTPSTARDPFLAINRSPNPAWSVKRSAIYNSSFDRFFGVVPGTTKQGTVTSITVKIEVSPPPGNYFHDSIVIRLGRRFSTFNTPIFQFGVFYEGDLELAPGANMRIAGDVSANGSIYMGSTPTGTLTLTQKVRYLPPGVFNGIADDGSGTTTYRKPGTLVGASLSAPQFTTSQATQVQPLTESENLQGGVDANELVARRPDLFPTVNDVYRSIIAPPPGTADPNETPVTYDSTKGDDPTISSQRIYNRAGLRVTVNTNNTVTIEKVDPVSQIATDVTGTYSSAINGIAAGVTDMREGKTVTMTTVDVSVLKTLLAAHYSDFNGVMYVNVKSATTTNPGGVRLINAESTPETVYNTGFSVATNAGLYIKGNYNTTPRADGTINPAMIMGDAITLLSYNWNDADSGASMYTGTTLNGTRLGTAPLAADGTHKLTIEAGILTGNVPAGAGTASGGAQNLVRYLEDMRTNSINVVMHGSVGRLFTSKNYTSTFQQPGQPADIYMPPAIRDIQFNSALLSQPPAGSPTTTSFSRGNFFMW